MCADLGEVKSGGSLNHVDAVSGLRKMLQISQSDKVRKAFRCVQGCILISCFAFSGLVCDACDVL